MFDFRRAYRSALAEHPEDALTELLTPWGETLDPDQVLQEYPRPQLRRASYANLNGRWEYAFTEDTGTPLSAAVPPSHFDGVIIVPFSPESCLSGVRRQLQPNELLWYRLDAALPELPPGYRCLLHFEAVDATMACFVDGHLCGTHEGGYLPFSFDITPFLDRGSERALITVCVSDPSETGMQPRGKQRLSRGTIWYTAQSGIWQTVWMEAVPSAHIERLHLAADPDRGMLTVTALVSASDSSLRVRVSDEGTIVAEASVESKDLPAATGSEDEIRLVIELPGPHLWTPDDPFLYHVDVLYGEDHVESYCAFRTFTVEPDGKGRIRFCCNHHPLFMRGLLDQGYWSDGMLTAPSDEALVFDIRTAHDLGFNMLRKHVKVECARWYYHCDRLGMIVWQDMVSGGGPYPDHWISHRPTLFPRLSLHTRDDRKLERFGSDDAEYRKRWLEQSIAIVEELRDHPCIATWTIFNEAWGQFDAAEVTEAFHVTDPTRPLDQTSGWYDQGGGDYTSVHNYFRTLTVQGDLRKRASVISEFGGIALHIAGHSSIDRAYGYQTCLDGDELQTEVETSLDQVDALKSQGLSGYVYTQLSDVEEEVNGLITYDRRIVKVHPRNRRPSSSGG